MSSNEDAPLIHSVSTAKPIGRFKQPFPEPIAKVEPLASRAKKSRAAPVVKMGPPEGAPKAKTKARKPRKVILSEEEESDEEELKYPLRLPLLTDPDSLPLPLTAPELDSLLTILQSPLASTTRLALSSLYLLMWPQQVPPMCQSCVGRRRKKCT